MQGSTNSANTTTSSTATTTQTTTGQQQSNVQTIRTLTVKKEPDDSGSPSTSTQQTISLTVTPTSTIDSNNGAQHHIVTQHENTDGTTSLSIAQVQGHQLIGNLNQVSNC